MTRQRSDPDEIKICSWDIVGGPQNKKQQTIESHGDNRCFEKLVGWQGSNSNVSETLLNSFVGNY